MTEFLPRSAWTDDPYPSGATLIVEDELDGLAIHWPGGVGSVPTTLTATIQILDGELAYHTEVKGWSDIAYNWAVDQEGRVWDLRGMNRRSAANGDTDVNRRFLAATCLIGPKDTPSPKLLQAVRDLRKKVLARYPKATKVVPHSAIRPSSTGEPSTDCPGDDLRAHIAAGTFTQAADVPQNGDDMSDADVQAVLAGVKTLIAGATVSYTKDTEPDPSLRSANLAEIGIVGARHSYNAEGLARAANGKLDAIGATLAVLVAEQPDIDTADLAAKLAPLLIAALPAQMQHFSAEDLAAIANAVADEQYRRQAE